jgi:hypothetical protein
MEKRESGPIQLTGSRIVNSPASKTQLVYLGCWPFLSYPSLEGMKMHGTPFQIVTYCLVVLILGYWLGSVLKTWKQRATFFFTLLVTAVLVRSFVGIVATAIPSILSIIIFERERNSDSMSSRYAKARSEVFALFPVQKWDGKVPLVVFDSTRFIYSGEVFAFINAQPPYADIRLCACRPVYMEPLVAADLVLGCGGDLSLPENVQVALNTLNAEISTCGPISWEQDEVAINITDLKERSITQIEAPKELAL